jgi:hypothetical protein
MRLQLLLGTYCCFLAPVVSPWRSTTLGRAGNRPFAEDWWDQPKRSTAEAQ